MPQKATSKKWCDQCLYCTERINEEIVMCSSEDIMCAMCIPTSKLTSEIIEEAYAHLN